MRDPCRGKDYSTIDKLGLNSTHPIYGSSGFVHRDLLDIRSCDAMLVYWWGDPGRQSIGTFWEMGYAQAFSKPLVVVDESPDRALLKHPFITELRTRIFERLEDGCEYINWMFSPVERKLTGI